MLHRVSMVAALASINVFYFGVLLDTSHGQSGQAEATAKATKRQAAEDSARSPLDIATPTDVGTPPRSSATAPPESEKLKRRAGEQVGDSTRGSTLILGMHVKEGANGAVEVAEVGAATPAQEAGIRKGDKIISFQNFKADNYRKWIDGMRRYATGAPDGSMITVVVSRDGNPVTTKVRVPENQIGPIKLPLGSQPGQPQNAQAPGNEVNNVSANGGNATAVGNSGAIASFFKEGQPGSERGVAELVRIAPTNRASESTRTVGNEEKTESSNADSPHSNGTRVGLAGFRNDANGMLLMVDVGGLDPGNYTVCITDAGALSNPAQEIADPTSNDTGPADNRTPGTSTAPGASRNSNPPGGLVPNSNRAPLDTPGAGAQPQSRLEPSSREIPATVLAQVSGNAVSGSTPQAGAAQPPTVPAAGQVDPANTGSAARPNGAGVQSAGSIENHDGGTAPPIQNAVGALTVDQSGTGRMQHVVEGIRVRSVIGQALVIYTATSSPAVTLPPNLDATADPASPKPGASSGSPNLLAPSASAASRAQPIVGGVIRLLSDRGGELSQEGANQPASPPAGSN